MRVSRSLFSLIYNEAKNLMKSKEENIGNYFFELNHFIEMEKREFFPAANFLKRDNFKKFPFL